LVVVASDAQPGFAREFGGHAVRFMTLGALVARVTDLD
jgi:hypothetical protein